MKNTKHLKHFTENNEIYLITMCRILDALNNSSAALLNFEFTGCIQGKPSPCSILLLDNNLIKSKYFVQSNDDCDMCINSEFLFKSFSFENQNLTLLQFKIKKERE